MKPKLLDLFCGAGGATKGYQDAGFYVVGVDINPQPRYCGDEFHQADAMEFPLEGFDVIHASPPCQAYSSATPASAEHPRLIEGVRERLLATGSDYVIENVPGAPLRFPLMLCGTMFGLHHQGEDIWLRRHRLFELSRVLLYPTECFCRVKDTAFVTGHMGKLNRHPTHGTHCGNAEAPILMGIDWMIGREIVEAIPPAYTRWIGKQLMKRLQTS